MRTPPDAKRIADCSSKINVKSDDSGVHMAHMKMSIPRSAKSRWTKRSSSKAVRASEMVTFPASAVTARDTVGSALVIGDLRAIVIQDGGKSQCLCVTRLARPVDDLEHLRLAPLGNQGINDHASHTDPIRAALPEWAQAPFACPIEVNDDHMTGTGRSTVVCTRSQLISRQSSWSWTTCASIKHTTPHCITSEGRRNNRLSGQPPRSSVCQ